MTTVSCSNCHAELDRGALVCPACGFPVSKRSAAAVPRQRQHEQSDELRAPVTVEKTAPIVSEDCDHAGAPAGAALCPTCGFPVRPPSRSPDSAIGRCASRAVLVFPWGEHALGPGDVVDVGREVGPFERLLESFATVGRRHATLRLTERGTLLVRDNASTNGTFVNGTRCAATGEVEVPAGSELRFSSALRVQVRFDP